MQGDQASLRAYPTPLIELEDYSRSGTIIRHIGFAKAFKRLMAVRLPR